jgi:hypothetical protein
LAFRIDRLGEQEQIQKSGGEISWKLSSCESRKEKQRRSKSLSLLPEDGGRVQSPERCFNGGGGTGRWVMSKNSVIVRRKKS